jgi:hypothetical protein
LERIWSAHGILIVPYIEARIKIITILRAQQKSPHTREDARTLENMIVLCWKRSRWDTTPWLHCKITIFLRFRIPSETKKIVLNTMNGRILCIFWISHFHIVMQNAQKHTTHNLLLLFGKLFEK